MRLLTTLAFLPLFALTACGQDYSNTKIPVMETAPEEPTEFVEKTDEEWKKELTPEQYAVLRHEATEPPNGALYKNFTKQGDGTYHCAGCGASLFKSEAKFDSGTGWPSFWDVAKEENIKLKTDNKLGYTRNEVVCAKCDGHLGHLFKGEPYGNPKDNRYCINGVALTFVKE